MFIPFLTCTQKIKSLSFRVGQSHSPPNHFKGQSFNNFLLEGKQNWGILRIKEARDLWSQLLERLRQEDPELHCPCCLHPLNGFKIFPFHGQSDFSEEPRVSVIPGNKVDGDNRPCLYSTEVPMPEAMCEPGPWHNKGCHLSLCKCIRGLHGINSDRTIPSVLTNTVSTTLLLDPDRCTFSVWGKLDQNSELCPIPISWDDAS